MTTYDPVKIIERPKAGLFSGLPSAAPGTVLVVDREGHQLRVLEGPDDRLTAGEVRWGQIRTLYAVDVTDHPLEFQDTFPCKDDIGGFRATVKFTCMVTEPADVVRRGIRDVTRTLVPLVTETLRRACGDFAAEEYDMAEKAGLAAVRGLETGTGHDRAFRISHIHLVLALDDAAATYVRERKEASRNRVRQQDAALLDREKTKLEAELTRTRDELEAERATMTARFDQEQLLAQRYREQLEAQLEDQRQELELARAAARARAEQQGFSEMELERLKFEAVRQQKQAELDAQKLSLDIQRAELQANYEMRLLEAKLERDRVQVTQLTDLLAKGEFAALAMQLSQDPGAIGSVNTHLANQRAVDTDRQLHALKLLIENDGLEGWQITEQAKSVLRQLINAWSSRDTQLSSGSPDALPEIESAEPMATADARDQPIDLRHGSAGSPATRAAGDDEFPADRAASGKPGRGDGGTPPTGN